MNGFGRSERLANEDVTGVRGFDRHMPVKLRGASDTITSLILPEPE